MKNLIARVLFAFFAATGEGDGWFPVEKKLQAEEMEWEEDPSIWVLFVKKFGSETIQVRFPADPVYWINEAGELVIEAAKDGEVFRLTVQEIGAEAARLERESAISKFALAPFARAAGSPNSGLETAAA